MTWRAIPAWPLYEVSDRGQVRRAAPGSSTAVGKVLSPKRRLDRRFEVCLYTGGGLDGRRNVKVHLLVAAAFLPPRPDADHDVDHVNGDPGHNWATNLRWLHYSINRSSRLMDELFGPVRTDWAAWEEDTPSCVP